MAHSKWGAVIPLPVQDGEHMQDWIVRLDLKCAAQENLIDIEALRPALTTYSRRIFTQASAVGVLIANDDERNFLGTAWVLGQQPRAIVTARHVFVGVQNPFRSELIDDAEVRQKRLKFALPYAHKHGGGTQTYDVNGILFDGMANGLGLDLVVLRVGGTAPLPAGLNVSASPPTVAVGAQNERRWVLVPGFPSGASRKRAIKEQQPNAQLLRCLPDELFDTIVGGLGFVDAAAGGGWEGWPFFLHTADTLPGVSGAPVIDLDSGLVVGVHTQDATELAIGGGEWPHRALLRKLNTQDKNLAFCTSVLSGL